MKLAVVSLGLMTASALVAADKVTYQDHILPIFRNKCLKCHNADKMKADLDLSNYDAAMTGSGNGPVLSGGNPDESLLYKVVAHIEKPTMPPKDKLPEKDIELIKKWVAGGLLMNSGSKAVMVAKPKVSIAIDPDSLGKRPEGPPPMPNDVFALDPFVRTARTSVSTAMAVSPWSPLIAIGGQRQVLLYNTDNFQIAGIIPFNEGYPQSLKFSANGNNLVIGGGRAANLGFSTVWDITKGEQVVTVGDDLDSVLASDISPDQRFIAHGGPDRFLRIFSTETGEVVHKIKKHTDWVTAVRFSTDGKYVASGDRNGGLHIWETEPGQRVCSFGHGNRVTGLEWATTNVVVSASMDGNSKIFNVDEARQLKSWGAHSGGAISLARAMNGMLVTSGQNKRATLWDSNGAKKRDFVFPGEVPAQAVPSHDAKLIIGSDWNGDVFVWNAADGKMIKQLSLNPKPMDEQYNAARKVLAEKQKAAKAAADTLQGIMKNTVAAQGKIAALDKAVADTTAVEAAVKKELAAANATIKKAQDTFAAAEQAAKNDAKDAGKKKATDTARNVLDKAVAAQKPIATKASAAAKAAVDAAAASKNGKPSLAKQIAEFNKKLGPAVAEKNKYNAAVITAEVKEFKALEVGKAYSDWFNARKLLAEGKAVHANVAAAAKAATSAAAATKAALESAKKTDLNAVKAQRAEAVQQAQVDLATSEKALAAAKLEVAKEQPKVDAATKAVTAAEAAHKAALANVDKAKAGAAKAAATAQAARAKATAMKAAHDKAAGAKRAPIQAILTAIGKAKAQSAAAKASSDKALVAINAEVAAANTIFANSDKVAKAAEADASAAKAAMDKYTTDLAKQKTDLTAKQKVQTAAKATLDGLIASKQKPAEAKVATMTKAATDAPVAKAAADKSLAAVNVEVKGALMAYLAAETAAQAAETAASKDAKLKADAADKRKAADTAKVMLDKLSAEKQKTARVAVTKADAVAAAAPVNKANAEKVLATVKVEVAKAAGTHKAATTAATASETLVETTTANLNKTTADHKTKAAAATTKRAAANASKSVLDKVIAQKQKPAQAAQTAAAATTTELTGATAAAAAVMTRINAKLAEAAKPALAADAAAKTAEAAAKTATENITKLATAATMAATLIDTRKNEVAVTQAAMAKKAAQLQVPAEAEMRKIKTVVTAAATAHANVEKDYAGRMQQLTTTIVEQGKLAETKAAEAAKLATELAKEESRINELKSTYEKLKTAAKGGSPKTASVK